MPLVCPECSSASLKVIASLELPPDSRSDEITLQIVRCSDCGFSAAAVYQESRRGALDSESVDHAGYRLPEAELRGLQRLIRSCPTPGNWRCDCEAHRKLGAQDAAGRWIGMRGLPHEGVFRVEWRR
jgi:hypothetical protein